MFVGSSSKSPVSYVSGDRPRSRDRDDRRRSDRSRSKERRSRRSRSRSGSRSPERPRRREKKSNFSSTPPEGYVPMVAAMMPGMQVKQCASSYLFISQLRSWLAPQICLSVGIPMPYILACCSSVRFTCAPWLAGCDAGHGDARDARNAHGRHGDARNAHGRDDARNDGRDGQRQR